MESTEKNSFGRSLRFAMLLTWLFCQSPLIAAVDLSNVQRLRAGQSYVAAEELCSRLLRDSTLNDADKVRVAVELLRTYTEHAINTPADRRGIIWNEAAQFAKSFSTSNTKNQLVVLVQIQAALVDVARGEIERLEAQVAVDSAKQLASARVPSRSAADQLAQLDATIATLLRNA